MSDLLNNSKPKVPASPFTGTTKTEFSSLHQSGPKAQVTKTEDTFKVEVDKGSMIVGGGITTYNSEDGSGIGRHVYGERSAGISGVGDARGTIVDVKLVTTALAVLFILSTECLAQNDSNAAISGDFEKCVGAVNPIAPNAFEEGDVCIEKAISNCVSDEKVFACFDDLANEVRATNDSLILRLSQSGRNLSSAIGNIQYEYSIQSKICVRDFDDDAASQCLLINAIAQTWLLLNLVKHK